VQALMSQPFIKSATGESMETVRKQMVAEIGENINVRRFVRFDLGAGLKKRSEDFAAEVEAQTQAMQAEPKKARAAAARCTTVAQPAARAEVATHVQPHLRARQLVDVQCTGHTCRQRSTTGAEYSRSDSVQEEKPAEAPKEDEAPKVAVDAKTVKQLRDTSGAGMMDCKKALASNNNNLVEAAVRPPVHHAHFVSCIMSAPHALCAHAVAQLKSNLVAAGVEILRPRLACPMHVFSGVLSRTRLSFKRGRDVACRIG
jgi:hypothetical protein